MAERDANEELLEVTALALDLKEKKVGVLIQIMCSMVKIIEQMVSNGGLEGYDEEFIDFVEQTMDSVAKIVAIEQRNGTIQ